MGSMYKICCEKFRSLIWIFITVIGIILMFIGIRHGELTTIMRKAIIICMECIGIG